MTTLSPAASAILEAFREDGLAAALTALAVRIKGAPHIRQDVLDIINELEQADD
jgi:hypothetical protein